MMLVGLGFLHMKAHLAAGAGLIAALVIAVFVYNMPAGMAGRAALFGGLEEGAEGEGDQLTLAKVHGYDLMEVTAMVGRQLPFFSVLVPFWLIWAFAGRKAMMEIWPIILVTGVSFAIPQYLVSNFIGPRFSV